MALSSTTQPRWGEQWRSSPVFVVTAMAIALFTDVFLYSFLVPILPYMLESRLHVDVALTQRYSFLLLSLSAGISVVVSIPIGYLADRSSSKKVWLLSGLGLVLVSTGAIALATSTFALFAGRAVQALASSIIWVVGYSTIADNVQPEHLGKSYGTISMAVGAGTSAGPLLAGMLFQLGGYWLAWSSAFVVIVADIILRLLMLERPRNTKAVRSREADSSSNDAPSDPERSPLLRGHPSAAAAATEEKTGLAFYTCILSRPQFICGITSYIVFAMIGSGFDATLPLHVRDVFHWGSLPSGLMFVGLSAPGIVLAPLTGWWKDRTGTRNPVAIGFLGLTPLFWLVGVPGDDRFPWANHGNRGQVIYAISMTAIGIMISFLCGVGTMEATQTIDELEEKHPGIFGPNKGYSRALSLSSTGWTLGSFIGPILSGVLIERIGYYGTNCVMAGLCAVSAISAFCCLKTKSKKDRDANHHNSQ